MKTLRPAVIALATALIAPTTEAQKLDLTEQQGLGGGPRVRFYAPPERASWAADGVHYVMRIDGKRMQINPTTGEKEPARGRTAANPASASAGRSRRSGRARPSPILVKDNDVYLGEVGERDPAKMKRLTTDGAPKRIATVSPDKAWVSFVRGSNLAIVEAATQVEWAVTSDGDDNLFYGVLDWVYQEEVYGRGNFRGHWWSGDSSAVAFLRLDESGVKDFTVIDHVPTGALKVERAVKPEVTKYPKVGDPNPTVQLKIAHPKTKQIVDVDMSGYDAGALIVRVGWTPNSDKLLFAVQDRIQTWMDLATADPETGAVTVLFRETSKTWVNRLPFPRYQPDGSFLWLSERTGYQHLYHYEADGTLRRPLTSGEWQVRRIVKLGELDGVTRIWFTGTKDGAVNDNLYRIDINGEDLRRLTRGDGRHAVSLNKDGSYFLDTVSTVANPGETRLCKGDSSFEVLSKATPRDIKTHNFAGKQMITIPARDGYPLDATLIVPPKLDSVRKHPIYLPTYSGPDAPSVRNSFSESAWQQFLAQRGCLILQVNVRSASGRGQKHTGMAYKRLGVVELRDLEDAVDYVCENHSGDRKRVAIEGWSYGGFMAGYALTHSNKFSLGLAGGGVYDWRLYDTIYTERYMSTPQLNPKGYAETSVIEAAKNLNGHLVIMHGVMDDNVHVQNAMQLIHALQSANKDSFELMLYPKSRHGVRSPHRRRFMWSAMQDKLGLAGVQ